ncbi:hypothetical protein DERF_008139 [Dermatophagoides farinae]|uniref:Uncharacterized protein n=1 Tax=Dermatophagoides farinae TaxID=6954 RepID=A0A922L570_DERFA|nr:hypothetical protein DERF_008139 [Dermatophagoides farinae]
MFLPLHISVVGVEYAAGYDEEYEAAAACCGGTPYLVDGIDTVVGYWGNRPIASYGFITAAAPTVAYCCA